MLANHILRNKNDIIEVCRILAEQENLKVTITESGKAALAVASGAFIGGLLAGRIGVAIGGSVTSIIAALAADENFKSVVEVLDEMTEDQKRQLRRAIERAVKNIRPQDYVEFGMLVLSSVPVKELVLAELGVFLKNELQLNMSR